MSAFDLSGKVAVVTGAGRGIGAAVAAALSSHGAEVVGMDVEPAADIIHCDVSDESQVAESFREVLRRHRRIDVLVNNAGIHRGHPPFDFPEADIELLLRINLMGCFYTCRAAARAMVAQRSGSIINVSALGGGIVGLGRGGSIYGATKGAIVSLTRDLAVEWAPFGVRVNAIAPGWIRTPMTRVLQGNETMSKRMLERVPMGRWGTTEDVAGPSVFLASDASGYITGHILPVDGGAGSTIRIESQPERA
jgi:2-deoxy-D-gluconate 3-dehydrogenase